MDQLLVWLMSAPVLQFHTEALALPVFVFKDVVASMNKIADTVETWDDDTAEGTILA